MATEKLKEHLLVSEHNKKVSELENEIKKLEDKLYHLEDENHLLHHKVKKLSKETKVTHKSTKITKPINVPKDDPFYTELGDSKTLNARENFFTFFDYHFHSIIRSKMLWVLLVALPLLFSLLFQISAAMNIADIMEKMEETPVTQIDRLFSYRFEIHATNSFLSSSIVTWLIAIPLLVFTCILLPSFITLSREDNLLKRLTINSMNRSQIFWFYILSSLLIFSVYLFLMFGVWLALLSNFAENIAGVEMWEHSLSIFDRIEIVIPDIVAGIGDFEGLKAGTVVTMGTDVFELFVFTFIFFIGLSALGFYKAMTSKNSRSLIAWGTGVFIFSQFTKLSLGVLDLKPFLIEMGEGEELDMILGAVLFCIKWMFVFTLPTFLFITLMTIGRGSLSKFRYGGLETDEFANAWVDNSEQIFTILQFIGIIICVGLFIYVWYNKEKIIRFEASR